MQDGSVGRTVMVLAASLFTAGGVAAAVTGARPGFNLVGSALTSETLPSWNIAEICASDSAGSQCRILESQAFGMLSGDWAEVPAEFRDACLGSVRSPYDRSYRLLSQCLEGQLLKSLDRQSVRIAGFGNPLVSAAHAAEAKAGDGYAALPTTSTADLIAAREAWGKGDDPKPVEAPLAAGAASPLPADAAAAPKGFEGEPTVHPLQATPPAQLTSIPQDQIANALKKLLAEREGWLKAPPSNPAATPSPAAPEKSAIGNGYAALPTTSTADLIAAREAWGKSSTADGAAMGTEAAKAGTASGFAVLPTTSTADLVAARETWGKGPDPKDVPAPLATGAYSPLPSDKVDLPEGFSGEPTVHALEATPAAQPTPVPQNQIDEAMKKLLAEREGWSTAPSNGGAKTAAAAPAAAASGGSSGYAILPTNSTADLVAAREAWGKGGPAKKVAAPLAAGAKSPLTAAKAGPLKGFSGEPKVHALEATPAAQPTPVPQSQIDDAMKKLLAERESWGTTPSAGGAKTAAAAPAGAARSAEAADCEAKLRQAASSGVILFESSSATISASSNTTLDQLASVAKGCKKGRIRVEGHTDSTGRASFNKTLSEQRAKAVAGYLKKAGVAANRIEAVGYGQEKPVASNSTPAGRAQNRRIEFTVVE
ncbi:MAG: OmpA family protein [Hyphomicrobiaceae bacterium]